MTRRNLRPDSLTFWASFTHTLRGKRFTYGLAKFKHPTWRFGGLCARRRGNGSFIAINHTLKGRQAMEAVIHETLHGCYPRLSEQMIETGAHDLTRLLWSMGARIPELQLPPNVVVLPAGGPSDSVAKIPSNRLSDSPVDPDNRTPIYAPNIDAPVSIDDDFQQEKNKYGSVSLAGAVSRINQSGRKAIL